MQPAEEKNVDDIDGGDGIHGDDINVYNINGDDIDAGDDNDGDHR